MDMTVTRDLAKVYHAERQTADAVQLYTDTRTYYMLLPAILNPDGDLDTPFDWLPLRPFFTMADCTQERIEYLPRLPPRVDHRC